MLLADMGAEVIKVEPPKGDNVRNQGDMIEGYSSYFAQFNRNKKSIVLDLYKESHDFQRMNTRTYRYMLDRMSKDLIVGLIALTLEINDLTESLRSKKQIMEDEANKKILARENKLQSNYRY